ncbi:glutamate racemase [Saccharibacillus sp. JS10]|uniref:glutamate racemase n=1 Tax=Saccharibacillus sp. JS10 TaxID=2950552 RepID=UPI00210C2F43|nr:glutamate racemase [Saccharibacillus sp. JS10]
MQQAIAILDSGVGGLTVAKEMMRQLPRESMIYFGDTARTPYGPRDLQEVRSFTHQIVDHLMTYNPKMIVIACNTATAAALDEITDKLDIPVIGVIHPGARAAISKASNGSIGVIGTQGTIDSGAYTHALEQISPFVNVVSRACPSFVPLVEQGHFDSRATYEIVKNELQPLRELPLDCLILGCTHYPFLADTIQRVMGPSVNLISSAEETAREVSTILYEKGQLEISDDIPQHTFLYTGASELFEKISKKWLAEYLTRTQSTWQNVSL